ncbi:MAG: gliding motility-associated C-terminal domain-containing protein, partial [Bacteroidota bacterium]
DMITDFASDVTFSLVAPGGQQILLSQENGQAGTAFNNMCFTPTAITPIQSTTTADQPYTGEWAPEQDFSGLIGSPLNGAWQLRVSDRFAPSAFGELERWSITFNNENVYSYQWTPGVGLSDPNSDTPVAQPTSTTEYILTVTDAYDCELMDTVLVSVIADLPPPVVSCEQIGSELIYSWDAVPGVVEYEYQITLPSGQQAWQGPITDLQIAVGNLQNGDEVTVAVRPFLPGIDCPLPTGEATCTIDLCGLEIAPATIADISCFGQNDGQLTINVTAGVAPYFVVITDALGNSEFYTELSISDLAPGDYSYTISDSDDCTLNVTFTIDEPAELTAVATQTSVGCANENASEAEVMVSGGTGTDFTYSWASGATTASVTNQMPGLTTVTVEDETGCTTTASVELTELPPITFDWSPTTPTCDGFADGELVIENISGGLNIPNDYTIAWADDATDQAIRTNLPGGQAYTATVSDQQGCATTQSFTLDNPAAVVATIAPIDPSCFQFTDGSATVSASSPNGSDFTYAWDTAAGNQLNATATNLSAGAYAVTVTDAIGCEGIASTILDEPTALNFDFSVKNVECFGTNTGSISLNPSGGVGGYQFTWPDNANQLSRDNLPAGDYDILLVDGNGCDVSRTVTVTQPANLEASVIVENVSCFGDRDGRLEIVVEGGTPPFRYSLDGINYTTSNTLIGLEADNYNIFIDDINNCTFTTTALITEPPQFAIDAGPDLTIIFGEDRDLLAATQNAQGAVEFVWSAPYDGTLSCEECPQPNANPTHTIDYEVYAIDEAGCEAIDRIRIFVDKPKLVLVPTGFSPNNDSTNDLLVVHGRAGTTVESFQVYDRWGELLFDNPLVPYEVNNEDIGWDGTFRDDPVGPGVYVWVVNVTHEDGTQETLRGQTTLIR